MFSRALGAPGSQVLAVHAGPARCLPHTVIFGNGLGGRGWTPRRQRSPGPQSGPRCLSGSRCIWALGLEHTQQVQDVTHQDSHRGERVPCTPRPLRKLQEELRLLGERLQVPRLRFLRQGQSRPWLGTWVSITSSSKCPCAVPSPISPELCLWAMQPRVVLLCVSL